MQSCQQANVRRVAQPSSRLEIVATLFRGPAFVFWRICRACVALSTDCAVVVGIVGLCGGGGHLDACERLAQVGRVAQVSSTLCEIVCMDLGELR